MTGEKSMTERGDGARRAACPLASAHVHKCSTAVGAAAALANNCITVLSSPLQKLLQQ